MTTDPLVDPADPASLNAYSYAKQNPVTFSDSTGLAASCVREGTCGASSTGAPIKTSSGGMDPNPFDNYGTVPPPPAPESAVNISDQGDRPGAHAMGAPDYSDVPINDWVSHNADPLADAALDATEMTLWSIVSALAGAVAFACGAEAVVTAPTVIAAAPGVACAGAGVAGAGAAGYQAGKSGGNLVDSILKIESVPGKAADDVVDAASAPGLRDRSIRQGALNKHIKGTNEYETASASDKLGKSTFAGANSARRLVELTLERGTPFYDKNGVLKVRWDAGTTTGYGPDGSRLTGVIISYSKKGWHGWPTNL